MTEAIKVDYRGNHHLSTLEARWAKFFTLVDIKYEYEPELHLTNHGLYLADYRLTLPNGNIIWAEVKPWPVEDPRHADLAAQTGLPLVVLSGRIPGPLDLRRQGEAKGGWFRTYMPDGEIRDWCAWAIPR
jgi:hypothetical protein